MDKIAGRVLIVCAALILAAWVFVWLVPATASCGAFSAPVINERHKIGST